MKNTFSILFYLKMQQKRNGLLPIMGRITVNKQATQFYTQLAIDPLTMEWDRKSQKVKEKGVSNINNQLHNLEAKIRMTYYELLQNRTFVTAEQVKNSFLGLTDSTNTILGVFAEYKQRQKDMVGVCRSLSTYKRITLVYDRVEAFIKTEYHRSDMCAVEVDALFVDRFFDFLFTTYKISNNQVQKIMQVFKHVTKICIKKGLLKADPFADHKIKFDPVNPNFLTVDELKLILQKSFTENRLITTKDLFVFSCFTGLAFVDAMNLKRSNITTGNDGKMWIKIMRQKTNILSIIPVMDLAMSIIRKYETLPGEWVLPRSTQQHINTYLKELAERCGINKRLTFHMARHTYATTAMSFGVPLPTIAKTMGHANMRMTQHYARVLPEKIINDISALNNATQQIQTLYQ